MSLLEIVNFVFAIHHSQAALTTDENNIKYTVEILTLNMIFNSQGFV